MTEDEMLRLVLEVKSLALNLDGVIADVEQGDGFDDVCLDTIKFVRDSLYTFPPVAASDTSQKPVDETAKQRHEPEPVAGVRCKIIENCKSCQHSVGRISCSLANRDFDSLERSAVPPDWCPLPLYTSPPKREWQGLTDEEIDTWNIVGHESLREFVRAIEAKLKEKNHDQ